MARPRKIELDYFTFDVDFFQDIRIRRLIKSQGGKSVTVYIFLLCLIYKSGYYMKWDDDALFMISEQSGYGEAYIQEVVESCVTLGLFDAEMFNNEKILTSERIQLRYADVAKLSKRVFNIKEFSLISSEETPISSEETLETEESTTPLDSPLSSLSLSPIPPISNSIFPPLSPQEKKEKKTRIINNSCEKETKKNSIFRRPTVEQVAEYCEARGNNVDAAVFCDFYESKGWVVGRSPMKDWKAAVRTWERTGGTDRGGGYMRPYRRESVTESIIRASRECDEMMRAEMEAAMAGNTKIDEQ